MYQQIYKNILFPLYETGFRGRNTLKYLNNLEDSQWYSREDLRSIQWEKLLKLLKNAYENVPFYNSMLKKIDLNPEDIKSIGDFQKIPYLTKNDIQTNGNALVAVNYRNNNTCNNETGGSTGEPINFVYPRESYEWRIAGALRSNRWTGWDLGKRTTLIWGRSIDKKSLLGNLKVRLHHFFMRRQYINAFYLSESRMEGVIEEIIRFQPEFLESYVSPLYAMAEYLSKSKISRIKPKAIITSAENLYDYQRELIEAVFGCKVFNRYGCSETMLIAAECDRHEGMHLNMDNVYIEFLKDNKPVKAGEMGEIVITDLNNYGMPFVRYKIGDIGVPSSRICSCGRGLPLMEKVEGRAMDIMFTKEGNFIQPQLFCFLFKEFDWIKQYQIIQDERGMLAFKVIPKCIVTELDKERFSIRIKQVITGTVTVRLDLVKEIPLTRSGKFQMVISKTPVNFGNS